MELIQEIKNKIPRDTFTDQEVAALVSGSPDRRYGLVKRALGAGKLIHLKRGLYLLGEQDRRAPVNLYEIAQKIYGPSYISMESALAFHAWIPETVFACTSASLKRSRQWSTPLGNFTFDRIPARPFFTGVELKQMGQSKFLMARPWKALADYVYAKKISLDFRNLLKSLRVDEEEWSQVLPEELDEIAESYSSRRVRQLLREVREEIQ